MKLSALLIIIILFNCDCYSQSHDRNKEKVNKLRVNHDEIAETISIFQNKSMTPVLTQVVKKEERSYIHPIIAPDGNGVLTEYRPGHHLHQTGIFWGLKLVNGRDFFMHWQSDYWRGVSTRVLNDKGKSVRWQTVYDMLDENGNTIVVETQNWTMQHVNDKYVLDLEWRGEAKEDVVMGKFYVGGLFVRMPWAKGTIGEIVNSSGLKDSAIEAQRAIWSDVGIKVEGRDDFAHIAIFDHPNNKAFPTPWRVDSQLGIGPSRQIIGDWKIDKCNIEIIRYRLIVYTGKLDSAELTNLWKDFINTY